MEKTGAILKKARETKGYSQEYVADKLRVSSSTISRLESNCCNMKMGLIHAYCQLLDVPFENLFAQNANQSKQEISPVSVSINIQINDIRLLPDMYNEIMPIIDKHIKK